MTRSHGPIEKELRAPSIMPLPFKNFWMQGVGPYKSLLTFASFTMANMLSRRNVLQILFSQLEWRMASQGAAIRPGVLLHQSSSQCSVALYVFSIATYIASAFECSLPFCCRTRLGTGPGMMELWL